MKETEAEHCWRSGSILNLCRVVNKPALADRDFGEQFYPYQRWVSLIYGVVGISGPAEKTGRRLFL